MGAHWGTLPEKRASLTNGERDRAIRDLGARQRQLVRRDQLIALGLSDSGISRRLRSGALCAVYPRVYAIHPSPYVQPQRWLAATYCGGPRSMISDGTAAVHLRLAEEHPPSIHITVDCDPGRRVPGLTVHRRAIDPRDRWIRDGIPCTSPARTIIDCAHAVGLEGAEQLLMAADSKRSLDRRRLDELVAEHRGRPGIAHVRALIADDPPELRNENERRMFSICRESGVPRPRTNFKVDAGGRTFVADFCWPELHLIVEADSWRWHGGRLATEYDADRDQLLAIAGWRVVHFTRDQIKRERERTGRRLLALTTSATPAE